MDRTTCVLLFSLLFVACYILRTDAVQNPDYPFGRPNGKRSAISISKRKRNIRDICGEMSDVCKRETEAWLEQI
ncbi:hypothetical protein OS493_000729 [Desmophyllum pertusum]|uniref:Uncharacterized protein n=1 Tax=Desmophyllum pertusum TaxID=174260 RepID=A0A9X0A7Q5_9CNID|nr:hypothetical protein OS493_000729 [Desmophyllum pertusum]